MLEGIAAGSNVPKEQFRASLRHLQKSPAYLAIRESLTIAGDDADADDMKHLIRTQLFPALRKETIKHLRALPHGVGGHPPKLTLKQAKQALTDILGLIREGKKENSAIADVAEKYNVSYRTMQRVWKKRSAPNVRIPERSTPRP